MTPLLSLVTGTMDRRESFHRLVNSIVRYTPSSIPWELIVSDASREPYPDKYPENVRIIPERPRLGFTKGYNAAFRECSGKWVIWLNDDAEVLQSWANRAVDFMGMNPLIGLGCLRYCEGSNVFKVNEHWRIPYANFGIINRGFGNKLGWLDEDMTMYASDNSLTFKVLMAGMGVGVVPGDAIIHHSVKDQHRIDNNRMPLRLKDAETLRKKYLPYHGKMLRTYQAGLRGLQL